jgi:hypothetical protein
MDFKNIEFWLRKKVLRLLPNICDFQKKTIP